MEIKTTRQGLRLVEHGVVISELRTSPGPTHSVFDVLAALASILHPAGRIGLLGFAGGGMMAPLKSLGVDATIETVDLDRTGYDLFVRHCEKWPGPVKWHHGDAVTWLRRQRQTFAMLIEDLSVPTQGDVIKPAVSWNVLPKLIRSRLKPGGVAVFNLMLPPGGTWNPDLRRIAGMFREAHTVDFDEFENRILIAGDALPSARELGRTLRIALRKLRSRQAERIHLHSV